jgi:hypothetical protein
MWCIVDIPLSQWVLEVLSSMEDRREDELVGRVIFEGILVGEDAFVCKLRPTFGCTRRLSRGEGCREGRHEEAQHLESVQKGYIRYRLKYKRDATRKTQTQIKPVEDQRPF